MALHRRLRQPRALPSRVHVPVVCGRDCGFEVAILQLANLGRVIAGRACGRGLETGEPDASRSEPGTAARDTIPFGDDSCDQRHLGSDAHLSIKPSPPEVHLKQTANRGRLGVLLKYLPLIWSGIWRKPGRTALILLQVAVAVALFGVLQGLKTGMGTRHCR